MLMFEGNIHGWMDGYASESENWLASTIIR